MASKPSERAVPKRSRRSDAQHSHRIEIQVSGKDADLIQQIAHTLQSRTKRAAQLRSLLARALTSPQIDTAFDIFGSDLPDETFTGVFDQSRQPGWRKVDL